MAAESATPPKTRKRRAKTDKEGDKLPYVLEHFYGIKDGENPTPAETARFFNEGNRLRTIEALSDVGWKLTPEEQRKLTRTREALASFTPVPKITPEQLSIYRRNQEAMRANGYDESLEKIVQESLFEDMDESVRNTTENPECPL